MVDIDIYDDSEYEITKEEEAPIPKVLRLGKIKGLLDLGLKPKEIAKKLNLSISTVHKDVSFLKNIDIGGIDEDTKNLRRIEIDEEIIKQIKVGKEIIELHKYKKPHVVGDVMKVICNLLELRMKLWKMDVQTVLSASETTIDGESILPDEVKDKIGDALVQHLKKKEVKVTV